MVSAVAPIAERHISRVSLPPERLMSKASMALSFAGIPNRFLTTVSWVCAMAGFLFGYSTSVINGSLIFMEKDLDLNSFTKGVVTSCIIVGAGIGALVGGQLADRFGRKRVMIFLDVVFIVFAICTISAPNFWFLVPFRALLGFAAGGHTSVGPVFLAEISTPESRSKMVTLNSLFVVLGELISYMVNAGLGYFFYNDNSIWRWMNGVVLLPAFILLGFHCFFIPESPRWLAGADQMEQAYSTLRKLRKTTMQTKREMGEIGNLANMKKGLDLENDSSDAGDENFGLISILCNKWTRELLFVALGIAVTQQICGICIAMYYGTQVLTDSGMDDHIALMANISIGVVSFLSTWLGIQIIESMGRRRMLIIGFGGSVLMHILIAACAHFLPAGSARAWSILGCLLVFLVFFQASIGPVSWLVLAEMFPLDIRGIGMGLSLLVSYATNCLEGLFFPTAMEKLGYSLSFLILAGLTLASLIFVWLFMPETKRKSLEQLEKQFRAGDWGAVKRAGDKKPQRKRTQAPPMGPIVEDEESREDEKEESTRDVEKNEDEKEEDNTDKY